jgi:hypothetical protein
MRLLCRFLHPLLTIAILLPAAGCGSGSSSTSSTGNPSSGTAPEKDTIGTSGGTVTTSDEAVSVQVPAGALAKDVTITVAPTDPPASGAVGPVYEIGPSGTVFATPVTLTLSYAALDLGKMDETSLRLATYGDAGWQILAGAAVDRDLKTVSGITSHLSPYGIVSAGSGAVCAMATRSASCAGDSSGTGSSAGSGNAPAPSGSTSCPMPTCADSVDVCAAYPGSTITDCKDDATTGVAASCCFAPDAPICFAGGRNVGCAGPSGGGSGTSSGGTCPGTPTCADTSEACTGYPGATFQDCTESASGYSGSCCFEPGAPVCVTVGGNGSTCALGTQCPPPERCADHDPCSDLPGTTTQDCTDTATGISATCCYAVGTLPPSGPGSIGVAGGSSGTGSGTGTTPGAGGVPGDPAGGAGGTAGVAAGPSSSGGVPGGTGGTGGTGGVAAGPGSSGGVPGDSGGSPSDSGGGPAAAGGAPGGTGGTPADPNACMIMEMPNGGDPNTDCIVMSSCPDGAYRVDCDPSTGTCRCYDAKGMMTTVDGACDPFDSAALLTACGFPTQ